MRIWIDLATPPQVLFFRPIVAEMRRRGHAVTITARDFSQTVSLADRFGLDHQTIGHHGGETLIGKGWAIAQRMADLAAFARREGFDLAASHNSYAQALACGLLRLPLATLMDYEYQPANHIAFRLARTVIVPEAFPDDALRRYGARASRVVRFEGIKEHVYLADFVPDPDFLSDLGVPTDKVVVTMRPPATMATYHRFENPLFDQILEHLLGQPEAYVVVLPRVAEQADALRKRQAPNLLVPREAVDGPNLIYHSDLVISAGGTMNREAAALGTPVYTAFLGRLAAVDRYLIDSGRMTLISEAAEIAKIVLAKKARRLAEEGPRPLQGVVDAILATAVDTMERSHHA